MPWWSRAVISWEYGSLARGLGFGARTCALLRTRLRLYPWAFDLGWITGPFVQPRRFLWRRAWRRDGRW
jgi:hypothetical protein